MHSGVHLALEENKTFIKEQDKKLDEMILEKVQKKLDFML